MGYSTNKQTLISMLPELELLKQGKQCIWTVENSKHFAYKVREALYIARLYQKEFPELAIAADMFRIEVLSDSQVQARLAKGTTAARVKAVGGVVNTGMEEAGPSKRMAGPQTATTIIQTWLDSQPSNDKFFFPEAKLSREELLKLHSWAVKQGWLFFVDSWTGGLTLQRKTHELEAFAWGPEDLHD